MIGCVTKPLPVPLRHLVQTRFATTSSGSQATPDAFPFPRHANPSPHEIFHLPRGASQSEIKSRYYELVRIHHPDCPTARSLPPSTSHSHFQAISDAYGILSGKKTSSNTWDRDVPYTEELRRRTRAQWRASAGSDEFGSTSASAWEHESRERWDQGILIFIVVFALSSAIIPLSLLSPFAINFTDRRHDAAQKNLANARREAKEFAEIRRVGMMRRKKDSDLGHRDDLETVARKGEPVSSADIDS
ncbi:hypothetical protein JB92DRAFT_2812684 [Gautieria morchelliformis]|nr:hypothetical protein JB92DRAFT_2812684 [Gautieria morchelliformis]